MKKKIGFSLIIFISAFTLTISDCKKRDNNEIHEALPVVTTTPVTMYLYLGDTMAGKAGGTVISEGGSTVIDRGVCWSTKPEPSILENRARCGNGPGTFSSVVTTYTREVTNYLRAYATNSLGTAYGNEVTFIGECTYTQNCHCTLKLLSPSNGSVGQALDIKLEWTKSCQSLYYYNLVYDIYLDTNLSPKTLINLSSDYFVHGLDTATTYYWKVVPKPMTCCKVDPSPVWHFTTMK